MDHNDPIIIPKIAVLHRLYPLSLFLSSGNGGIQANRIGLLEGN